jgi:hypothetical protein
MGTCVHDAGCKMTEPTSSELDARATKFLDKSRPISNNLKAITRMGFYPGEAGTNAFREFHNSRMMKKMRPRIEHWKYSAQRYASRNSIR